MWQANAGTLPGCSLRLLALTLFAAPLLGGVAEAEGKADGCHRPPGNRNNYHTISVSPNAMAAHLAHGDLPGACATQCDALCSDGLACTVDRGVWDASIERCICSNSPVVCTASDQCHVAGTCDPATGTCSDPAAPDGTPCSDGNACTRTDTCRAAACSGADPVTCTASDQCHVAGECDPATGTCSNPTARDGTACIDGNACTQDDTCQAGACSGADPVTCTASDQCHVAGECDPATGTCPDPAAPDGTPCSDGNACTVDDTCQAGACTGGNRATCSVFEDGTLSVTGTDEDDTIVVGRDAGGTIFVNGGAVEISGPVTPTVANTSLIRIFGMGGSDDLQVDEAGGPMPPAEISGGEGDDSLSGGTAADQLDGGPDNDRLRGGRGNDRQSGGGGDDEFVWDPGDGSDIVEGQAGFDTLVFNGSDVGETVALSANGQRLRFTRDVGNIIMDCDDVEQVRFHAAGGADRITVDDLGGTDVGEVDLGLAAAADPAIGDGEADTITLNATSGDDVVLVTGDAAGVSVFGLAAVVNVSGGEVGQDGLRINVLGGDDVVDASGLGLEAVTIQLTVDGGAGADVLIGGGGDDVLLGGEGDDVLIGGPGNDTLDGGPGDNIVIQG